ncbi:MAG: hypothetical protein H7Z41_02435, partial [Cytophagales bacterium]|nr:hypothetical protein [Armatimonadota bacterium]
ESLVEKSATHRSLAGAAESSLWNGAFTDPNRADLPAEADRVLQDVLMPLSRLEAVSRALAEQLSVAFPLRSSETDRLLQIAGTIRTASDWEPSWLEAEVESLCDGRDRIRQLHEQQTHYRAKRDSLLAAYAPEVLALDQEGLCRRLEGEHESILHPLLGEHWQREAVLRFDALSLVLTDLEQGARELYTTFESLAHRCGVMLDESLDGKQRLLRIAQRAADVASPRTGWFVPGAVTELIKQADAARTQWVDCGKLQATLYSVYTEQILELDHAALRDALKNPPTGLGRLINTAGLRAAGALKSVTLPGAVTRDRDAAQDLDCAAQLKELLRTLEGGDAALASAFGGHYGGAATDWDALGDVLRKAEVLCTEFAAEGGRIPSSLAAAMVLGGSEMETLKHEQKAIGDLFARLRSGWESLSRQVLPASLPEPQTSLRTIADWCHQHKAILSDYQVAYRRVVATCLSAEPEKAAEPDGIATLLTDLRSAKRVRDEGEAILSATEALRPFCGSAGFQGEDTDWDSVRQGIEAAIRLREALGNPDQPVPAGLVKTLTNRANRDSLLSSAEELQTLRAVFDDALQDLGRLFAPRYLEVGLGTRHPEESVSFPSLSEWLAVRIPRTDQIARGLQGQSLREEWQALGLGGFFDALCAAVAAGRTDVRDAGTLRTLFRAQFYHQWTEAAAAQSPPLAEFIGENQDKRVARFRSLDQSYLDGAPGRVREMTRARPPRLYPEEVKALKGQLVRRRTGEVRKLLAEIPNLLFALKPCVMMNPLSVRLFLDSGSLPFDVVLFDDASQIATEDAIGAILRGKQVIIAGDPKQLPPLSLIQATAAPTGESAESLPSAPDASLAFESVLDAASSIAQGNSPHFARYSLNWHYRSQNESLIAFSRRYFYPTLVSFPSAQVSGGAIAHISVTDSKDETGSESTERVFEVALDYKRRYPSRSVGVITLTETDYAWLLDVAARRRDEDPESVASLLQGEASGSGEGPEPFFIKMIENVQGDERDLIILHVGGDPSQFAPLLEPSSDRLLNVATTRARCDMVVVSALTPFSVAAAAATAATGTAYGESQGIQMLRAFLQYAQNPETLSDTAGAMTTGGQDLFVRAVRDALAEKGYELHERIGMSDYQVDLAIVDPAHPERYLLGIECDGPSYAVTETARHRDRLCRDMLAQRGWNLHRVWSLEWNRDPQKQQKRIEAAVAALSKA